MASNIAESAVVYKAICITINSTPVAIKSIDLDRSRPDLDDVQREEKTLSLLSHPNILKAICSFTVDHRLYSLGGYAIYDMSFKANIWSFDIDDVSGIVKNREATLATTETVFNAFETKYRN
ncbi:unnamed protein product [Vicia faba]|uniref:Protein kinase domain-containing protein n=1 Tax=Vicia faba TaxID=3906 RepID=A0AAV1AIT3_VICFA|nr:unnamed protein product [Vicia faba]